MSSIDPRLLSQLLQMQFTANTSSIISGGNPLGDDSNSSGSDMFSNILQTLLAGGTDVSGLSSSFSNSNSMLALSSLLMPTGYNVGNVADDSYGDLNQSGGSSSGSNLLSLLGGTQSSLGTGTTGNAMLGLSRYLPQALTGSSTYDILINNAAGKYGVDPTLVKAVIDQESSFNPHAESSAGAKGLMQLMDGTARGLSVTDSFDPEQNINGGTRYLANLLQKYDGNEATALAAYNAGSGRLEQLGIHNDRDLKIRFTSLPSETQNYVMKVMEKRTKYQV
ncbi:lytic transglycosylase domain-containing protein [Gorillibacterium massiliense]|uniref:lytic transglycosylase domain-containing protein n=1 Tax=Gorillibacterium massiliense TaxID=1280390 RepID=UPI0005934F8F|nr:lytic transglycosylase domain-containing protein [Gorillibacterium massiliense]